MHDLSTLLVEAAGTPPDPLDLREIHRRAASRRRTRWQRFAALLVAAVGLGTPAGIQLLPASSEGTSVQVGPGPAPRPVPVAPATRSSVLVGAAPAEAAPEPAGAPSSSVDGGERADRAIPDPSPLAKGRSRPAPPAGAAGAGWSECYVDSDANCDFVATEPSGYVGRGEWQMTVWRNAVATYYNSATAPACAARGFIQPGDHVIIHVGWDPEPPPPDGLVGRPPAWRDDNRDALAVGPRWRCGVRLMR